MVDEELEKALFELSRRFFVRVVETSLAGHKFFEVTIGKKKRFEKYDLEELKEKLETLGFVINSAWCDGEMVFLDFVREKG